MTMKAQIEEIAEMMEQMPVTTTAQAVMLTDLLGKVKRLEAIDVEAAAEMLQCVLINCKNVREMRDLRLLPVVETQVKEALRLLGEEPY